MHLFTNSCFISAMYTIIVFCQVLYAIVVMSLHRHFVHAPWITAVFIVWYMLNASALTPRVFSWQDKSRLTYFNVLTCSLHVHCIRYCSICITRHLSRTQNLCISMNHMTYHIRYLYIPFRLFDWSRITAVTVYIVSVFRKHYHFCYYTCRLCRSGKTSS